MRRGLFAARRCRLRLVLSLLYVAPTAGAVGCFIRFLAGARLGLAVAAGRFAAAFPRAALDGFLALGRALAPFFFWTFDDFFLRLAIVDPLFWLALRKLIDDRSKDNQLRVAATHSRGYQQTFSGFICPYPPHLSTLHVRR